MGEDYKITGAYRDMREADRAVLDQIVQRGDDLRLPRHTLLFFYGLPGGGPASFEQIAGAAEKMGLSVSRLERDVLILEGHLQVHPAALKPLIDWAVDQAEDANAEFDGWECAIIPQEH